MPFARICSNRVTSFIVSLFIKKKICDSQSGFRLYNLELIRYMKFNLLAQLKLKQFIKMKLVILDMDEIFVTLLRWF